MGQHDFMLGNKKIFWWWVGDMTALKQNSDVPFLYMQAASDYLWWYGKGKKGVLGLHLHTRSQGPCWFVSDYTTTRNTIGIIITICLSLWSLLFSRSYWDVSTCDLNRDMAGASTPAYVKSLMATVLSMIPKDMTFLYFTFSMMGLKAISGTPAFLFLA